jgi:hypothetical protein
MNLVPNGAFESGLNDWESTPSGVTLVRNETKRFVMLAAERHSAAICSEPIDLVPGGAYRVEVERAIRGDCDLAVIGRESLLHPDSAGEVIASESPVRVQVTARPGHRVGVSRVLVSPVGQRARILNVRSTAPFVKKGEPFEILCDIRNTGSEPIAMGLARLVTLKHDLAEEHRAEVRTPIIGVGATATVSWNVIAQRTALAPFEIQFEYASGAVKVDSATLRHTPRNPDQRTLQSVTGAKKWFSVGTRGLRITAHDTDLDMGPSLLAASEGDLGVLLQLAQISLQSGACVPLWSVVRTVSPGGVALGGKNEFAEWVINVRPDHANKGISVELRLSPRRRLERANIELLPFQTTLPLSSEGGAPALRLPKSTVRLVWSAQSRTPFHTEVSESSGLVVLRSETATLMPGMAIRAVASVTRAASSIIRGE